MSDNSTEMVMKMAKGTIDRRVARTRELLHQALMSLILKKRYKTISIKNICDAANVGRSTFYAHYTSKDDLKRSGLEHMRRRLVGRQRDALTVTGDIKDRSLGFSLAMFEHARDHIGYYRALAGGSDGTVALGIVRQTLSDLLRNELTEIEDASSANAIPREIVVQYLVGAYLSVLTWWLDGGAKLPPQHIDAMFRRLATEGIMPSAS
jgi:AcrR family transcriptional regulator